MPLAVAVPAAAWVAEATRRASLTPLGRDQGLFQYVAWAIRRGAVDYRDVHDVNGPLTHLVHLVFLRLGGADDHRFRVLDLVVTGATFAIAGACLPGLGAPRAPRPIERAGWGLAGWVVLSGQYLLYDYWHTAQRESFFDWFLLPSLGLQLVAPGPMRSRAGAAAPGGEAGADPDGRRRRATLLGLAGALSVIPWFGKPTYALFTLLQLGVLALGSGRRRAVGAFVAGGAAGATTQLAFLLWCGDAVAFARTQLVEVPAMYCFIWPRAAADVFSEPLRARQAGLALAGAVVCLSLVAVRQVPARFALLALAPCAALAGVIAQGKAFPYHFHPVTATLHLQWLALAACLAERTRVTLARRAAVRVLPIAAGAALGLHVAAGLEDSPYIRAVWLLSGARSAEQRQTAEYFAHFPEPDFFPFELRQAAAYLRRHTGAGERVQAYGMDPYVLFLAGRLSATPYIYAYDLDADAALAGGTGGTPDEAQAARIRAMRDAHETDLLERLQKAPPGAFLWIDGSPLLSRYDAWDDFEEHCPRAAAWIDDHYEEVARFGHDHVWLPHAGDLRRTGDDE
ncbi:MAG: hypothetical protein JOZ69_02540 [Myxococcales bacterium]|nr:hypothetical protein [Myxococcales bacterium]